MKLNIEHINEKWKKEGINLIYFGDMHHRVKAPSSRIDDFEKTELSKINQLRALAKEFNAKAFVQPGDFLDSPSVSEQFMNNLMDWWGFNEFKAARQQYDAGEITKVEYAEKLLDYTPIVGIVGNHELYGGSYKSFNRTSLKFLDQRGFIHLVDKDRPYIIKGENGVEVAITGDHFDIPLNKYGSEADLSYYEQPTKYGDVDIYLTHGYLAGKEIKDPYSVLVNRLTTQADLTINGHIHDGFPWTTVNGKIFGNPGAMAQQSNADTELNRVVQATLIHIDDSGKVFVEDIPLDLPEPKDIFNMDEKDENAKNEKRADKIKELINSVSGSSSVNTSSIIKSVALEENVPVKVRDIALNKTYEKMKEMGANAPLDQNVDYRIKKITLHNFESHQHTEVDVDQTTSPTLVIGESSQGKSSILRGIYWVLENQGDAKSFVRRKKGVRDAYVEIERMDGTKVKRFVEVSKSRTTGELKPKKNGYIITDPSGDSNEYNTGGVLEAQSIFGLNYLQLDDKETIPINFQKQEDGWYFIGLNDSQRAKVIGALYGTQYISSAIKSLNRDKSHLDQESKLLKSEVKEIDSKLDQLKHIDQISKDYNKLISVIDEVSNDGKKYDDMRSVYNEWLLANKELNKNRSFVNDNKPILNSSKVKLAEINSKNIILNELNREYESIYRAKEALDNFNKYKGIDINDLSNRLDKLSVDNYKYSDMTDVYKHRDEHLKELDRNKKLILHKDNIKNINESIKKSIERESVFNKSKEIFNERLSFIKELKEINNNIEDYKSKIKSLEEELKNKKRGLFTSVDYGIIKVYKPGGENNMELKELGARIDKLNNDIIIAETQAKNAEKQIELSNKKLQDLGINPDNAREEILEFKESLDKEYNELKKSLDDIQSNLDN